MGLELPLPKPRFRPWANAVVLLGLAGFVALMVLLDGTTDPGTVRRYAERMLWLYDAAPDAPRWQSALLAESVGPDLERDILAAYRHVELDDESRLQLALVQWRFGKTEDAAETLHDITDEAYLPLVALVQHRIAGGPAPSTEDIEAASIAVGMSDSWWGWFLREQFQELAPAAPVAPRRAAFWERVFRLQLADWAFTLAAFGVWLGLLPHQRAPGAPDKYFTWLGRWEGAQFFWGFARACFLFLFLSLLLYLPFEFLDLSLPAAGFAAIETVYRILPVILLAFWLFPTRKLFVRALGLDLARVGWKPVLAWTAWGVVAYAGLEAVVIQLGSAFGNPGVADALDPELIEADFSGLLAQIWMAGVAAPIAEEFLFRGMLYPVLRRRLGVGGGLVAQSAVFASIHFYTWIGAVAVFLAGLLFGWLFERSRSLWPPILLHALGNIAATVLVWSIFGPQ